MSPNQFSQNNNKTSNSSATIGGYDKKAVLAVVIAVTILALLMLATFLLTNNSQQNKDIDRVTAAARKHTPDAQVRQVRVADGFAMAIVSDPSAGGQANAGNITIFKVNKDGSMTQIASGSYFSPIDLLGFGIPLATQAKLTKHSLIQVKQNLADTCGYSGGNHPGYNGFDGSFNPGDWQIDSGALGGIEQELTTTINDKNFGVRPDKKIICVNATRKNSNATTDGKTFISTFTLELQLITGDGTMTTHKFTFAIGPNYYRSYKLDGQEISNS